MVNQQLFFHRKIGSNKLFCFYYGRGTTNLFVINRCGFIKLQRQLCDGNADANADDRDDYKYLFLYLCCLFFH